MGMLEMDGDFRELRSTIGDPGQLERANKLVGRMYAWVDKSAFVNRPNAAAFSGSAENFRDHHEFYRRGITALKAAVETMDPQAMMIYAKVKMSCEICHREFRPGL